MHGNKLSFSLLGEEKPKKKKNTKNKNNAKEIICTICGIGFDKFTKFDIHNWEIHQKTPSCDLCGKSYKNRRDIWIHKKRSHEVKKEKDPRVKANVKLEGYSRDEVDAMNEAAKKIFKENNEAAGGKRFGESNEPEMDDTIEETKIKTDHENGDLEEYLTVVPGNMIRVIPQGTVDNNLGPDRLVGPNKIPNKAW